MNIILCHIFAFIAGYILDLIIGDPHSIPHPVRLIGRLISLLDRRLNTGDERQKLYKGILTVLIVTSVTVIVSGFILAGAYYINVYLGIITEAVMTYQILAVKSLRDESMKVYDALKGGSIDESRKAVSMIVGRDTDCLDETGVTKAAVETVAENTSDGVIAPMIFLAIGGPVLGFLYKAINTMDSMIGYKNDKYMYFGRAGAKTDDVVNFIPARLSALLMICAAFISGQDYDGHEATRIFLRDRFNHKSPNSAQTESVCAGALRIRLAGPASYFGKTIEKPYIGDDLRPVIYEDIKRACRLMYVTTFLCMLICAVIMMTVYLLSPGM